MTPNVGDMIESFQKLWNKMETNHIKLDSIQETCHQIGKSIEATDEYRRTLEQLTTRPRRNTRKAFIAQIRMEQRYSGALNHQNSELRLAIQTHKKALDEIMGKYREQVKLLKQMKELEEMHKENSTIDDSLEKRRLYIKGAHEDLPAVISQACDKDSILIEHQGRLIDRIKQQNERMRRSLISFGESR